MPRSSSNFFHFRSSFLPKFSNVRLKGLPAEIYPFDFTDYNFTRLKLTGQYKWRKNLGTKKLIYGVVLKSFAHQGYNGTKMDQIAEVCSVSKGTLYYNFKTKEDLFIYVMHTGLKMLLDQFKRDVLKAKNSF